MMELRHLRYFIAVAEERNFGRAAARLNMSQPPLSRQIQELEALIGVALFTRSTRAVELTSAGRAFLPKARSVLFESRAAEDEARRWASGHHETITVGFMSSVMLAEFHQYLEPFHNRYPAVTFRFSQMRSDEQLSALLDERIDIGFVDFGIDLVRERLHSNKIEVQHFLRDELCVALPTKHPLARRDDIRLEELRDESFAILERHLFPAHHDTVIAACRDAGFAPRIRHYGDQIPTVLTYVAASMGICIAPRLAELSWNRLVSFVSLSTRPHIDIHMISRRDCSKPSIRPLRRLIDEISRPAYPA